MQRRLPSTFRGLDAKALHSAIKAAAERVLVRLFSYASEETTAPPAIRVASVSGTNGTTDEGQADRIATLPGRAQDHAGAPSP
ncbi:hypothetical protein G6F65_023166 [Rhizopus arrhizus]|nr:hypothetical protein G6F65_023166 [Rhizopus arrhizus]